MAVRNRALCLATAGLLCGSPLAIATNGFLQLPEAETPVVTAPPPVSAAGPAYLDYHDQWQAYRYIGEGQLVLVSDSTARFDPATAEPVTPVFSAVYESIGALSLTGEAEIKTWNEEADMEDLILTLALRYFYED